MKRKSVARAGKSSLEVESEGMSRSALLRSRSWHLALLVGAFTGTLIIPALPALAGPGYVSSFVVGGCPGWVHVNDATGRAYVNTGCYPEPGGITVMDADQPRVIERLNLGQSVSDLAVNQVTNRIYAKQDGDPGYVGVIDGASNRVISKISVGKSQGAGIALNAVTDRIYVSNYWDHNVSVIDGAAGKVLATIDLIPGQGSFPTDIAVNSRTNRIYVECFALRDSIPYTCVIDGESNAVIARVRMPTIQSTYAVDERRNIVYAASLFLHEVLKIDGATNQIVDTVPTIGSADEVSYNPNTDRLYVSSGGPPGNELSARLLTVDGETFKQVDETLIGGALLGIGIYSPAYRLFVVENFGNKVVVLTEDAIPPASTLHMSSPSIQRSGQPISGSVNDDFTGVGKVKITYSSGSSRAESFADLTCSSPRACSWSTPGPSGPGTYLIQVQGIDKAGSIEPLGPTPPHTCASPVSSACKGESRSGPYALVTVV